MPITEVFANPTVKKVIFQIRYPNLFYLENKIGDLQLRLLEHFPESALLFRRQVLFADLPPDVSADEIKEKIPESPTNKIWQFKSPRGYQLNVLTDSLDITSNLHKTYNNEAADDRFKDIIEIVLSKMLDVVKIPILNRIGLRYIDECPIPETQTTSSFQEYYNSTFPLERFSIEDSIRMQSTSVVKKGEFFLRYVESLERKDDRLALTIDFDGYAVNAKPEDCLEITDKLHDIISEEYDTTIKEPVKELMRRPHE